MNASLLQLSQIPNFHKRMSCLFVILSFEKIAANLTHRLTTLCGCIDLLASKSALSVLWRGILSIGNTLNEGTARGNQKYFKVAALRRVMDVRGIAGMTLIEYLAAYIGPIFTQKEWRLLCQGRDGKKVTVG